VCAYFPASYGVVVETRPILSKPPCLWPSFFAPRLGFVLFRFCFLLKSPRLNRGRNFDLLNAFPHSCVFPLVLSLWAAKCGLRVTPPPLPLIILNFFYSSTFHFSRPFLFSRSAPVSLSSFASKTYTSLNILLPPLCHGAPNSIPGYPCPLNPVVLFVFEFPIQFYLASLLPINPLLRSAPELDLSGRQWSHAQTLPLGRVCFPG